MPTKQPSVCIVHDWLTGMRGGEKVLKAICDIFPNAPIYTLFAKKTELSQSLKAKTIHTSFLQHLPGIENFYRWLLPIFPIAIRSLNVKKYDFVISISHCIAKSVKARNNAVHICYCLSPARYVWDFSDDYFKSLPKFLRVLQQAYFAWFKKWDQKTAQDVTHFIDISKNISAKILKFYGRKSKTIYPAVDLIGSDHCSLGNYYLLVGAMVPYKRADLAIEAFNFLKYPLIVIGDGPCRKKFEKLARQKNIRFEGWVDEDTLIKRFESAKALIFPGEEDFGIVPLEAQAFGKPVIAYGKGGVIETVIPHTSQVSLDAKRATGLFFYEQTPYSLVKAVQEFEQLHFDATFVKNHSKKFSRNRFDKEFRAFLKEHLGFLPAL